MIGYHYTSLSNWKKIQEEGLKPYLITNPEVTRDVGGEIYGIWVWQQNPEGGNERGIVMDKMIKKEEDTIVKLKVEYEHKDTKHYSTKYPKGVPVELYHRGSIGESWVYHDNYPAHIINRTVPTTDIGFVKMFRQGEVIPYEDDLTN